MLDFNKIKGGFGKIKRGFIVNKTRSHEIKGRSRQIELRICATEALLHFGERLFGQIIIYM